MVEKRLRKTREVWHDVAGTRTEGAGDVLVISFGSPVGPIREAMERLERAGAPVRLL